jgi:hypothetical protein
MRSYGSTRREFLATPAALAAAAVSAPASGRAEQVGYLASWSLKVVSRVTIAAGAPRHRAFPGMEKLRNGDLLVAYREGTDHWKTSDGQVKLVRSRDGGKTWSAPSTVLAAPGKNYGTHSGIAQLSDGTLLLPALNYEPDHPWGPEFRSFNAQDGSTGPRRITSYILRSTDNGQTWSEPQAPDVDGLQTDFWWNPYGKILQLPDTETVLWPITRQKRGEAFWRTGLLVSKDLGRTWTSYRNMASGLADEKNLAPISGGRWLCLIRDLKKPYYLHQTESADNGLTWSPAKNAGFLGHCPCLIRTRKGALVVVHRNLDPDESRGAGLHYSFDDGQSWHKGEPVYVSPEPTNFDSSYPSLVQLDSGEILCVYYTCFREGNCEIEGAYLTEL